MIDYSEISHPNPGYIVGRLTPVDPQTGSEGAPFFIYSRREVLIGRKATWYVSITRTNRSPALVQHTDQSEVTLC